VISLLTVAFIWLFFVSSGAKNIFYENVWLDKLPAQTNPDPKESDDLLSHYPKLEKIKK